jgi:hypothetical protein
MTSKFDFHVSFRMRHPTISVKILVDALGLTPKWSWQVGEPRRTRKGAALPGRYADSYCTFDVASGEDGAITECLREFLAGLSSLQRDFICNVSATGGSAAFYVFWYPNGDTGEVFEADLLAMLGELGISLMLNVYDDRNTPGDGAGSE